MASLTPGILLRLLQSMNSEKKPTGEHRSALLQITAILPAISDTQQSTAQTPLDLWPNHGFLLQLSDSKNSTYVTLSERDTDLILSNKLQLGQFVYVDRFLFDSSPLPTASGLRPTPGRHPFVGSPDPLAVRVSTNTMGFIIHRVQDQDSYLHNKRERQVLAPRFNDGNVRIESDAAEMMVKKDKKAANTTPQRFRSPGVKKERAMSVGRRDKERDPSPATKVKRSASPVPSKCVVPSLVVAKEETRRTAREPAIVVPSRYRQASPTVGRRRLSLSPARRLSSGNKKNVVAGIGGLKISGEAAGKEKRKNWDEMSENVAVKEKNSGGLKNKPDFQAIIRTQAAMSRRLSDANSHESKDDSSDGKSKSVSHNDGLVPNMSSALAAGITVHDRKWTDGSIPLDSVSSSLAKLGKDAIQRKAVAATAAAEALQEALATESVVRSLSMFSDLCSTSKTGNPLPTIERFLSIYDIASKSASLAESVTSNHGSNAPDDATTTEHFKSASAWVEAALSTDLDVVSFFTGQNVDSHPVALPRSSSSKRQLVGNTSKNHLKGSSTTSVESPRGAWKRGHDIKESVDLAAKLKSEMEMWFLNFVEQSLDAGFRVFNECGNNGNCKLPFEGGSIAAILSQLKRINDWLDLVVKKRDVFLTGKIDGLKRKIYGFVIQHVGTNLDSPKAI